MRNNVKQDLKTEEHECPASTYFRTSDVSPFFDDEGVLHYFDDGGGYRRRGTPSVRSSVAWLTEDILSVKVVGWHKHTVSPVGGTYYFVRQQDGSFVRRRANAKVIKAALLAEAK